MMLEAEEVERIRVSWARAASDPGRMSQTFYANLFRLDPSTKPLFVGDIDRQGRKLAQTLAFIVDHVDQTEVLLPAARDLAVRHVAYNVAPAQYTSVGTALLTTFRQLLGSGFTHQDEAAWVRAYTALADAMCEAAYGSSSVS